MGEVIHIGRTRATRVIGEPWQVVDARVVPYGASYGVAYRFANGKSWTHYVGTFEQAEQVMQPIGSTLPAPDTFEPEKFGREELFHLLVVILRDLYASGIHAQIASASERGWMVRLGDRHRGCVAEHVFGNDVLHESADWLIKEARGAYPASEFARRYAGFPVVWSE